MEMLILKTIGWKLHTSTISEMAYSLLVQHGEQTTRRSLPLDYLQTLIKDFVTFGLLLDGCLSANYLELTVAVVVSIFDVSKADSHRAQFMRSVQAHIELDWVILWLSRLVLIYSAGGLSEMLSYLYQRSSKEDKLSQN